MRLLTSVWATHKIVHESPQKGAFAEPDTGGAIFEKMRSIECDQIGTVFLRLESHAGNNADAYAKAHICFNHISICGGKHHMRR